MEIALPCAPEVLIICGAIREGHVEVAALLAGGEVALAVHAHREYPWLLLEYERRPVTLQQGMAASFTISACRRPHIDASIQRGLR